MTLTKVFMNEENIATFVCPKCEKSKTSDVSKYKDIDQAVKIKVRCPCTNVYSVLLERRKYYRKEVNLPGTYKCSQKNLKGPMKVKDLSRFGLKFDAGSTHIVSAGDRISVEFTLDDSHKTVIQKDAVVRTVHDAIIGAEFRNVNDVSLADRRLGFYLMP